MEVSTVCSVVKDKVLIRECRTDQVKVKSVAGFRPSCTFACGAGSSEVRFCHFLLRKWRCSVAESLSTCHPLSESAAHLISVLHILLVDHSY